MSNSPLNKSRRAWLDDLARTGETRFNVQEADAVVSETGRACIPLWFRANSCEFKVARGQWDISSYVNGTEPTPAPVAATPVTPATSAPAPAPVTAMQMAGAESRIIPDIMPEYVKWGNHKNVAKILASGEFYPIYVTGLSGNGKTTMILQAAAQAKRTCFRVNITRQTDESDLIGGFRLVNGDTVWVDGAAVLAAKEGAILLLDEIDLGGPALMCLQPLLEGNAIYVKKTGEWVKPAPGFTVVATANTKGKGDETGSFAHTGIMNEAMLDRFPVTLEQPYPTEAKERDILKGKAKKFGVDADAEENFILSLCTWAANNRKAYEVGATSDIITTRRLESILKAFSIFGDRMLAIEMGISRFDEQAKADLLKLYEKISGEISAPQTNEGENADESVYCPFE
jgi:MoxR-like ATPase